jgi:hypothetical protein
MKIQAEKGQDFKAFEIEVQEVSWENRCWMMDKYADYFQKEKYPPFSYYGEIVIRCTDLDEHQLNKYSNHEIQAMGQQIFLECSKKK